MPRPQSPAWAETYFERPLYPGACRVCGLLYLPGCDTREHRRYHRRIVSVFDPQPTVAMARQFALHGPFVPVRHASPRWLRHRLYEIARGIKRERGYDFIPWSEYEDEDGHGVLIADSAGRALGGAVVRWREYTDAAPAWVMAWAWIAPQYRRCGLLRRLWLHCAPLYPGIYPEPPYSDAAAAFVSTLEGIPDEVRAWALRTLQECG